MAELQLKLRVSPKASRNAIEPWNGEVLRIKVTAAPDRGKANAAVLKLLARQLGLPRSALRILRGQTGRDKLLAIAADASVLERLPRASAGKS